MRAYLCARVRAGRASHRARECARLAQKVEGEPRDDTQDDADGDSGHPPDAGRHTGGEREDASAGHVVDDLESRGNNPACLARARLVSRGCKQRRRPLEGWPAQRWARGGRAGRSDQGELERDDDGDGRGAPHGNFGRCPSCRGFVVFSRPSHTIVRAPRLSTPQYSAQVSVYHPNSRNFRRGIAVSAVLPSAVFS